jgi:hypothetical protein
MSDNKQRETATSQPAHLEEKGVLLDAIVSGATSGVVSTAITMGAAKLQGQPPPSDPPPAIELPPGVDPD